MSVAEHLAQNPAAAAAAVAGTVAAGACAWLYKSYAGKKYSDDTGSTDLIAKSIKKDKVEGEWKKYDDYFTQDDGKGVICGDKTKAPGFVDTFYNLVTDIYEWGWGQSFHFSPALEGKSDNEATRVHEIMLARAAGLEPGKLCLDAGCGVGGPMRNIAAGTGGKVQGITINDYQVERCTKHNKKAGLADLCSVTQGNFLEMPFEDNTFDCAYSIEATCHAPRLQDVYSEIFRVLKPGAKYATYEWLVTPGYDKNNKEHVTIIDNICHGNALPDLRSIEDAVAAAKEVGFEVLEERDVALPPALPWYRRLNIGAWEYKLNHVVVSILSAIGVAPKGTQEVHKMLVDVARDLAKSGELNIFTPMHLIVMRKPE